MVASTMPARRRSPGCRVRQPAAEPAGAAVDEHQREPDHDRRDREGQVDQRVQEGLAGKRRRTSSSAQRTPKTVLSGTAIAAMMTVS